MKGAGIYILARWMRAWGFVMLMTWCWLYWNCSSFMPWGGGGVRRGYSCMVERGVDVEGLMEAVAKQRDR